MLVLNVDDDIDDREMFQAAINDIDPEIECLQFESGIKFLEYATQAAIPADFLFIDINMPKMNGYECLERLREVPGNQHMVIAMYSTAFNPKLRDEIKDTRIKYITKTSRPAELVQSLKMILSESRELAEKLN